MIYLPNRQINAERAKLTQLAYRWLDVMPRNLLRGILGVSVWSETIDRDLVRQIGYLLKVEGERVWFGDTLNYTANSLQVELTALGQEQEENIRAERFS